MKSLYLEDKTLSLVQGPIPNREAGEALIRVLMAGICKVDSGPGLFDPLIEATGDPQGINQALDLVRPRGTIVVKSTSHELSELDLARITVNEITLIGSRCGDLDLALSFLENKRLDVLPLIEGEFELAAYQEAFALAGERGRKKVLIDFS